MKERRTPDLALRLAEAEATIEALLSGQIDAVVDLWERDAGDAREGPRPLYTSEEYLRRRAEIARNRILDTRPRRPPACARPRRANHACESIRMFNPWVECSRAIRMRLGRDMPSSPDSEEIEPDLPRPGPRK